MQGLSQAHPARGARCSSPPTRRAAGSVTSSARPRSRRATSPSGAAGLPRDAYLTGWYLGRELAALGINMNFAPTADTYSDPEASAIGPRSFGSDPAAAGLLVGGVRRRPRGGGRDGHGQALPRPRLGGPGLAREAPRHPRRPRDPARAATCCRTGSWRARGVPAVMSGHLAFPDILGDLTPASLSPFMLTDGAARAARVPRHGGHRRHGDGGRAERDARRGRRVPARPRSGQRHAAALALAAEPGEGLAVARRGRCAASRPSARSSRRRRPAS